MGSSTTLLFLASCSDGTKKVFKVPQLIEETPRISFSQVSYSTAGDVLIDYGEFALEFTFFATTQAIVTAALNFGFTDVLLLSDIVGKTYTFNNGNSFTITSANGGITFSGNILRTGNVISTSANGFTSIGGADTPSHWEIGGFNAAGEFVVNQRHGVFASNTVWTDFFLNATPETLNTDPYSEIDGESDITGPDTGTVAVPGYPGLSATSTGIIGLFAPSAGQMQQLSDFMWTDFGGTGTTTEDILAEIVQALKRLISNPLDYVLGLNIIPSQGLSVGSSKVIQFGFVSSGVSMPELSSQYFTVDCGSIAFDAVCGDTFLDYAPYSKFSIYLPYIGVKEVDANDFVGHTIGVVYHGDVVTGGVTAYITKDSSVMYQFSGCCALNVPLSADNWGNTVSAAVNIATALISGGATGGAAGVAKAAALGASSVAANPSLLSPQVAHSGAISGGAGAMGVQYPFVIREAVRFHSTDNFNELAGYPSFYYKSLADIAGYTKILSINLENIPATQDEIAEIENILKEGAIF